MSTKVEVVKRLDMIKTAIELEEEDLVHLQIDKLKLEENPELSTIIQILENDEYEKINDAIDDFVLGFKNSGMTPHQQKIFDQVTSEIYNVLENVDTLPKSKEARFLSLKGSAGVGKTFVASKIIEALVKKEYSVTLTTPTHKALGVAKYMLNTSGHHVPVKTLQSFLKIKLQTDYNTGVVSFVRTRSSSRFDFEMSLDILIVDESSMVSRQLLSFIEEDLLQKKVKVVLFIGDEYQLPPVDEGKNAVTELKKQYELTEVVRQAKGSYIKSIAIKVKNALKTKQFPPIMSILNKNIYPDLTVFNDQKSFLLHLTSQPNWHANNNMVLSYSNADVEQQNRVLRNAYWVQFNKNPSENILENEMLIAGVNEFEIENSRLIKAIRVSKNFDPKIQVHYWRCTEECGISFSFIDFDDQAVYNQYLYQLSDTARAFRRQGKIKETNKAWQTYFAVKSQYGDFKYAFASTIHKSQGSTYNSAYINLSGIINLIASGRDTELAFRLLYVAVTRASKNIIIYV